MYVQQEEDFEALTFAFMMFIHNLCLILNLEEKRKKTEEEKKKEKERKGGGEARGKKLRVMTE